VAPVACPEHLRIGGPRTLPWGTEASNGKQAEVPEIGLRDKIVGAGKDMFELEQQAKVPNPIKCLCDVEKDTPAILFSLKGGGNGVNNLLDSRVMSSESTLMVGDYFRGIKDRTTTFKEFLKCLRIREGDLWVCRKMVRSDICLV
jgi:hypothetical protein